MAASRHRALNRRREEIAREENQSFLLPILPIDPCVPQSIQHGSKLCYVDRLRRLRVELERLDAIDIVEVNDRQLGHSVAKGSECFKKAELA
jgi:hypothetical protein